MSKNLDELLLNKKVEELYRIYLKMGIIPNKSCFMIQEDLSDRLTIGQILNIISQYIAKKEADDKEFERQEVAHHYDLYWFKF